MAPSPEPIAAAPEAAEALERPIFLVIAATRRTETSSAGTDLAANSV